MYGAILGDIIGSPYEFDRGNKRKDFPLFNERSRFTDDTVLTIAVCKAFIDSLTQCKQNECPSDKLIVQNLVTSVRHYGLRYPDVGYGNRFLCWLEEDNPLPYGSYGNGSAMRVSSISWLFNSIEDVRNMAILSAKITHNHPEGIKGAEAIASAIFLARTKHSKTEIKNYVENEFGYSLNRTCDEIRPTYYHIESCMRTVPEAIIAFLDGNSFEDVIRNAISLGGDCDTLAAMAGSIAEGYYGIPHNLKEECCKRLPSEFVNILSQYEALIN